MDKEGNNVCHKSCCPFSDPRPRLHGLRAACPSASQENGRERSGSRALFTPELRGVAPASETRRTDASSLVSLAAIATRINPRRIVAVAPQFREESVVDRCKEGLASCGSNDRVLSTYTVVPPAHHPRESRKPYNSGFLWEADGTQYHWLPLTVRLLLQ